ncbi:unnamed protein product [Linum tenue]|uniref:GDSL esterase/lipase n=1 Tax=Linum tenue TaxID=586396 RepID=A0AAV0PYC0_9ROSI|nr:unnamed protein product [Linum tenue]
MLPLVSVLLEMVSRRVWVAAAAATALMVMARLSSFADGEKAVPCYYIFGDSLADSGNNNMLQTVAKVDYSPYGVDFPRGPTGRFTNGRNIVDFFAFFASPAEYLGFECPIPPFATATDVDTLTGVNYASGSAGILQQTGAQLGQRIPLDVQLDNHGVSVSALAKITGAAAASRHLGQCLYTLGAGNNDFLNNYFRPEFYPTSRTYTVKRFTALLANRYAQQLQRLYGLGARKIGVFALGQIGCVPFAIRRYGNNGSASGCAEALNDAAALFNVRLKSAINRLQAKLTDAQFVYIGSGSDMLMMVRQKNSTTLKALEVVDCACCTVEVSSGQCVPDKAPCPDRSSYVFWDWFHPTEALNSVTAAAAFEAVRPLVAHSSSVGESSMLRLAAAVQAM